MEEEHILPERLQDWEQIVVRGGKLYGAVFPVPDKFLEYWLRARQCYLNYEQTHDQEMLREAIKAWEQIYQHPDFSSASKEFRLPTLIAAGDLSQGYTVFSSDSQYLYVAVACYEKASKLMVPGSAAWVEILNDLASILYLRSELTGSLEDLTRSVQIWDQALPSARSNPTLGLEMQVRLGCALSMLHTRGRNSLLELEEDASELERSRSLLEKETYELERSISLLENAWTRLTPDSPLYFECLNHLSNALSFAWARRGETIYIDRAIELLEQGVAQPVPPDCIYAPYIPLSLGAKLLQRYDRSQSLTDLDRAIELLEQIFHSPPDMELEWCKALSQFSEALVKRYEIKGDLKDLQRALEVYQDAVVAPDAAPFFRPKAFDGYGSALKLLYDRTENPADLDAAIRQWEQAVTHDTAFLFLYLEHLAEGLEARFKRTGNLADLTRAIEVTQRAIDEDALGLRKIPLQNFLATRLTHRYERTRSLSDVDQAIKLWDETLDRHKISDEMRSTLLHNLSVALRTRFERTGDVADYDRASQLTLLAFDATPADSTDQTSKLRAIAQHLYEEYERTEEPAFLDAAIEHIEQALEQTPKGSPKFYFYMSDFGLLLASRGVETNNASDLDRAIEMLREAAAKTSPDSSDLPHILGHLSVALTSRFDLKEELPDLEEAIRHAEQVISLTLQGSTDLPGRVFNLAQIHARRYRYTKDDEDSARAVECYRRAAIDGVDADVEVALKSARLWGNYALERATWTDAIEAYNHAQEASERLFQIQLVRRSKENWLQYTQGLSAHLAYALARTGDLQAAVMTLERGAARLIAESSEYSRTDLTQLKESGQAEVYERYRQAEANWNQLAQMEQQYDPGGKRGIVPTSVLQSARTELDSIVEEIRKIPGYESFHRGFAFSDVQRACGDKLVVYIAVTPVGALALLVSAASTASVTPLWLPNLTESSLSLMLYGGDVARSSLGGYLGAYSEWGASGDRLSLDRWRAALDDVTSWLWDVLMGQLTEALGEAEYAYLIPIGVLGLLPLHAAWTANPRSPTGRLYALDRLTFAYVPNARALSKARSIAAGISQEAILAIEEPQPVMADPIPNAAYEVETAVETFRRATVLRREEATRAAVLSLLHDFTVLHFACHSRADLVEPAQTSMVMAHDEPISVADLLGLRLKGIRLAVLSSCETGVPGVHLADEMFSLSSGLLQAGVAGVAASLWRVKDVSTMMLMFLFYQLWREEGLDPVASLRDAQIWVRDKTNKEKADYFKRFIPEFDGRRKYSAIATHLYRTVALRPKDGRDFASPYDWAAFSYFGV